MIITGIRIKEGRIHCCGKDCRQRDSAEHEGYDGVPTDKRITENNITNADRIGSGLLEEILGTDNINKAYKRVKSNKGAQGVYGMKVEHLLQYLKDNGEEPTKTILDGRYRPNPVRRVEIPKDNGKMRKLGIPTAVDRVVQQAIAQILSPIYEPQFCKTSYGFRPNRSVHDALKKCLDGQTNGCVEDCACISRSNGKRLEPGMQCSESSTLTTKRPLSSPTLYSLGSDLFNYHDLLV